MIFLALCVGWGLKLIARRAPFLCEYSCEIYYIYVFNMGNIRKSVSDGSAMNVFIRRKIYSSPDSGGEGIPSAGFCIPLALGQTELASVAPFVNVDLIYS